MVGYIFNAARGETPGDLDRQRQVAEALLMANMRQTPRNIGEGLNSIAQALVARSMMDEAGAKQKAGMESATAAFSSLMPGGNFPAAPPSADPTGAVPSGGGSASSGLANGIRSTADALGVDPTDLATIISYETAGTFDPTKRGPTTQWGQHRGLIQFGEPQAAKYGVDWANAEGSQLGPDGAIAKYMRDAGVQPGMGILDIYSAVNAGRVGRYNASDANNGGAPGTVRDKVENQMGGHRRKALALLGIDPSSAQAAGAQVASLDPSIGMPQPQPDPQQMAGLMIGRPEDRVRIQAPIGTTTFPMQPPGGGAVPMPQSPGAPGGGVEQVAQAIVDRQQMAPAEESALFGPDARQGPSLQQLLGALAHPYLSDGQRQVAEMLFKVQMQRQDPAYQMGLEKAQLELDALRRGPAAEPFTLGEGQVRFDGAGNRIAAGPDKQADLPSAVREYEFARQQGFPGTFQDWEASKKGGMSLQIDPATGAVTFQQGQNIKPLTEGQSKDTVFATRAAGALPIIDKMGDSLTGFVQNTLGQTPLVGNYLKSEEYQQAEQAGTEFLQAILRKDTGAAITPQETEEYGKVYLPRPGDSQKVLAQKKASRARALEALKAGMPPQGLLLMERALSEAAAAANTDKSVEEMSDEELEAITNGR